MKQYLSEMWEAAKIFVPVFLSVFLGALAIMAVAYLSMVISLPIIFPLSKGTVDALMFAALPFGTAIWYWNDAEKD